MSLIPKDLEVAEKYLLKINSEEWANKFDTSHQKEEITE